MSDRFQKAHISSPAVIAKVAEHTKLEVSHQEVAAVVWGMDQAEKPFNAEHVYPWISSDVDEDMRTVICIISAIQMVLDADG